MKILSLNYDSYMMIKDLMNRLKKRGVYNDFNSSNIMVFDNGTISFALAFTSKSEDTNYGITLFFGEDGLYSLEDMLTLPKEEINEGDYNLFVLSYKPKSELSMMETNYFNQRNMKLNRRDNLTITTYKNGYAPYVATTKEAKNIEKALYLCNKIMDDSYLEIVEQFKNPNIQSMLVDINMHKHIYSLHFGGHPKFEGLPHRRISTLEELNMFKDLKQEDYALEIRARNATIPVKIKGINKAIDPLLLVFGWPFSKFKFNYLISNPEEQRDQMLFLLKDFFTENGLPTKMTFNNRLLFDSLKELFGRLNIEVLLDRTMRTDGFFDDISITLHKIYDTIYSDQDYCTVSEESIRLSLDTISRVLETINTGDPNLECSEEEKDIITAFIDTIAQTTSNELNKDLLDPIDETEDEEIERYTETKKDDFVS